MPKTVRRKLYSCPPLAARILERQCRANRDLARSRPTRTNASAMEGAAFEASRRVMLAACLECPGVRALASKGKAEKPQWVTMAAPRQTGSRYRLGWKRGWRQATNMMRKGQL